VGNSFIEVVFGGMMVVSSAIIFLGQTAINKETLGSSFTLGFQALPSVFGQMPFGQFFGFLFFFLLFLAAITSTISMLQPAIALLEEGLKLSRKSSVTVLGVSLLLLTFFVIYFSKNLIALDTFDFWITNVCVFISATFQIILFGWVLGMKEGMEELERGAKMRIPWFVKYLIKYVASIYLVVIFATWVYSTLPERIAQIRSDWIVQLSIACLILLAIFFLLIVSQALLRWEKTDQKESHDSDYEGTR